MCVCASVANYFSDMTYVWNETYYRRALDNSELWMFSAVYQAPGTLPLHTVNRLFYTVAVTAADAVVQGWAEKC